MRIKKLAAAIGVYMTNHGLILGGILPEVDKLDSVPEFQRPWYSADAGTGKFKLDFSKVDVEDVTGLRNTVAATRREIADSKAAQARAVTEALEPFKGIDPVKTKQLLSQFDNEEEAALISQGAEGIKRVIEKRTEKLRAELARQVDEAQQRADGALEVASSFMEQVLDNHIRAAASKAGIHPSAIDDALLRGRGIFSLNDEGEVVQFEDDSETVVMGKDGKTSFSPAEWLEGMKKSAPHWFPAGGSGGGATGDRGGRGGADLSGLSPTQQLTEARLAARRK